VIDERQNLWRKTLANGAMAKPPNASGTATHAAQNPRGTQQPRRALGNATVPAPAQEEPELR